MWELLNHPEKSGAVHAGGLTAGKGRLNPPSSTGFIGTISSNQVSNRMRGFEQTYLRAKFSSRAGAVLLLFKTSSLSAFNIPGTKSPAVVFSE